MLYEVAAHGEVERSLRQARIGGVAVEELDVRRQLARGDDRRSRLDRDDTAYPLGERDREGAVAGPEVGHLGPGIEEAIERELEEADDVAPFPRVGASHELGLVRKPAEELVVDLAVETAPDLGGSGPQTVCELPLDLVLAAQRFGSVGRWGLGHLASLPVLGLQSRRGDGRPPP